MSHTTCNMCTHGGIRFICHIDLIKCFSVQRCLFSEIGSNFTYSCSTIVLLSQKQEYRKYLFSVIFLISEFNTFNIIGWPFLSLACFYLSSRKKNCVNIDDNIPQYQLRKKFFLIYKTKHLRSSTIIVEQMIVAGLC